jgi:hypothetical protein
LTTVCGSHRLSHSTAGEPGNTTLRLVAPWVRAEQVLVFDVVPGVRKLPPERAHGRDALLQ